MVSGNDSEVSRRADDKLRIIAITGHVEPEYIAKAIAHGIDQVFPKPMPVLELGKLMQEHGFISRIPEHLYKRH
jgi:CheY-like chemotaxis protein